MAHSALHFAVGLAAGTAFLLPSVLAKLRTGEKAASATGRMIASSYALGLFSVVPNILRHCGIPAAFCDGWWMNLFLFNPLIDRVKHGGLLVGEISILLMFAVHYVIILDGIMAATRRNSLQQG